MRNVVTLLFAIMFLTAAGSLFAQDVPHSIGPAPYVYNTVEPSVVFYDAATTSRVFTINATSISASQWRKYFAGTPGTSTVIGPVHPNFFGCGDQCGAPDSQVIYTIQQVSPYVLYSVDTVTGNVTNLGSITGINPGHSSGGVTSMAWDETTNTTYLASTNITQSQIYTFNLATRVATPVGSPITNAPGIIALICNPAGSLFAIDLVNDNFWRINKTTGTATMVGALGYNANYGQDADFDPRDGIIYWAAIGTGSAQLRTIDTATGTSTLIGNLTGFSQGLATIVPYANIVGGIQKNTVPDHYALNQNFPNPFNPSTKISFALPEAQNVKLVVHDIMGREVATLVNERRTAGTHQVEFDASSLASGVYFYKIEAGSFTETKKMLLVK